MASTTYSTPSKVTTTYNTPSKTTTTYTTPTVVNDTTWNGVTVSFYLMSEDSYNLVTEAGDKLLATQAQ